MSTIKCKFCGRESESQYHEYCGFLNVYYLDGPAAVQAAIESHKKSPKYKASQMYHDETLKAIQNISVEASCFKYNESKQTMEKVGSKQLFGDGLDGVSCSQSYIRSSKWIAHFEGEASVTINYVFAGKKRSVSATISPKQSEGIWYLCLHIDDKFNMEVGLYIVPVDSDGSKPKYQKLAVVALNVSE